MIQLNIFLINFFIITTLKFDTIFTQVPPRKIHCLDQTSTECYIVNTFLPQNNSNFKPVSANPLNVVALRFESSVIPQLNAEICKSFPNLRTISALKSMVEDIDAETFAGCENLNLIDLGHNRISHLDKNVFNRNKALRTLSLHDNNLEFLDPDLFVGLTNLKRLVLSLNSLEVIPIVLFRDLTNLKELALHHNSLSDFDVEKLIEYCPKLSMIHLRDNNFRCDRLRVIIETLRRANVNFWDYVDKIRPRNYTVEFIQRMECLSEEQFQLEMKVKKNLTNTVVDMENEIAELKEELNETKVEEKQLNIKNYLIFISLGFLLMLLIGMLIGCFIYKLKHKRRQSRSFEPYAERMVIIGTDFTSA